MSECFKTKTESRYINTIQAEISTKISNNNPITTNNYKKSLLILD